MVTEACDAISAMTTLRSHMIGESSGGISITEIIVLRGTSAGNCATNTAM